MRVGLIIAHSCDSQELKPDHARWSIDYVSYYIDQTAKSVELRVSDSVSEANIKALYRVVVEKGKDGASREDFRRRAGSVWKSLDNAKKREECLTILMDDYPVVYREVENGKKGPNPIRYIHVKYCSQEDLKGTTHDNNLPI